MSTPVIGSAPVRWPARRNGSARGRRGLAGAGVPRRRRRAAAGRRRRSARRGSGRGRGRSPAGQAMAITPMTTFTAPARTSHPQPGISWRAIRARPTRARTVQDQRQAGDQREREERDPGPHGRENTGDHQDRTEDERGPAPLLGVPADGDLEQPPDDEGETEQQGQAARGGHRVEQQDDADDEGREAEQADRYAQAACAWTGSRPRTGWRRSRSYRLPPGDLADREFAPVARRRPHPPRMTQQPAPDRHGRAHEEMRSRGRGRGRWGGACRLLVGIRTPGPPRRRPPVPTSARSADDLRTSLSALAGRPGRPGGHRRPGRGLDDGPQDDWAQLADDARGQYAEQVDGVQADADAVQAAVDTAQADPSAQTLGNAAAAVAVFLQDAGALVDEVRSTC